MKKEEPIHTEFTERKSDPEIIKIVLNLDDQVYKIMRKTLSRFILLRDYKSKLMRKLSKLVTEGLFDYYGMYLLQRRKNQEDLFWTIF